MPTRAPASSGGPEGTVVVDGVQGWREKDSAGEADQGHGQGRGSPYWPDGVPCTPRRRRSAVGACTFVVGRASGRLAIANSPPVGFGISTMACSGHCVRNLMLPLNSDHGRLPVETQSQDRPRLGALRKP